MPGDNALASVAAIPGDGLRIVGKTTNVDGNDAPLILFPPVVKDDTRRGALFGLPWLASRARLLLGSAREGN
jgi:hypothetical protein